MKFRELNVGDTFDFVGPDRFNSYFLRCVKTSQRKYRALPDGPEHTIGSVKAEVFHVERKGV